MRRWIVVVSIVQLVGVVSSWFAEHPHSAASSFLWGLALFALLPGNLLSTWAVQKLLWQSHLSLATMSAIATVLCVGINAVVWFGIIKAIKVLRIYLSRRSAFPGPGRNVAR
jgi:hypothetical protein